MPGSAPRRSLWAGKTTLLAGLVLGVFTTALALAGPAQAATLSVNSLEDEAANDGKCTLREAITSANNDTATGGCAAGSGDDVIKIGVEGTVKLGGALPDLSSNISIEGPGADQFTVRRTTGGDYSIFFVAIGNRVSIDGITVSGGNVPGSGGGGIYNAEGTVTVTNSTVSDNSATSGAGIYSAGDDSTLTIENSTVSNNTVTGDGDAVGGGGIYNGEGTVTVTDSTVSGNSGGVAAGGIFNDNRGSLTVERSTVGGNSADEGGGIVNFEGAVTVTDSTVSGNSADEGGGILSDAGDTGQTSIVNSTVSGNSASSLGGGVYSFSGTTLMEYSTIAQNKAPAGQGGGVASSGDGSTSTAVLSTIISANQGTDVDVVNGSNNSFASGGYNIVGDGDATGAFGGPGDKIKVGDPGLGPLSDNGGPTQTHALLVGSPAIDNVAKVECPPPSADQRGVSRPQGASCDSGSFEKASSTTEQECTIKGTSSGNVIRGTSGRDVICSYGGDDVIYASGGNDLIRAGSGRDIVYASGGKDEVYAGSGNDLAYGNAGEDRLSGQRGDDTLYGGPQKDVLLGGAGRDKLFGSGGDVERQ